jgi:putative aldouronate transport system permease protein
MIRRIDNSIQWKSLYLMMLPGILYFVIFRYGSIYGLIIAFKDFRVLDGILASPWVGFKHFEKLISTPVFGRIIFNTLKISLLKLFLGFSPPIILALMLNEVGNLNLRKFIQTISYLPHFISWVIISGILFAFLNPGDGLINSIIMRSGGRAINFLTDDTWFISLLVGSEIWKEVGWGAIIYLAALSGIDQQLYEAARIDGASRWEQIKYISFPSILPVIAIMLILRMGNVFEAGFEQIYILYNPQVYDVADVIDTWVFRNGIVQFRFSIATAVGLAKSIIGMILILLSNWSIKLLGEDGLW